MNLYSRTLRHIDMNRVKKLHEEKVKQKKLIEKEKEQIIEDLRNLNSPEFSNWRCELKEGMTSSGVFQTTLPATGDTVLSDFDTSDPSILNSNSSVSIKNSGSGSGFVSGFNLGSDYISLSASTGNSFPAFETPVINTTTFDTLTIGYIAGTNTNGGIAPSKDLEVIIYDVDDFDKIYSYTIPGSKSSGSRRTVNIPIPENVRGKNTKVFFYTDTYQDDGRAGAHFGNFTINIPGLNHATIGDIPMGLGSSKGVTAFINLHSNRSNPTQEQHRSIGYTIWFNAMSAKYGPSVIENPLYPAGPDEPYQSQYLWAQWDPAPVSGNTNGNPDGSRSEVTDADYIYIGEYIYNTFHGAQLYGINNISFKRRTPITVFVPLDSPEAAAFIRTDPIMANLSPEERKKKLQDMLNASDEYIEKILGSGFPGTSAVPPGEYDPFKQALPGQAGDTPGVEIAGVGPYGPGHMPAPIPPANSSPRGPYTPIKDYGTPGNPKFMPSGPSKNPWGVGNKNPKPQKSMVASYEPKGQLISEKRKLKSPQEILKKIPGYYDGKPAPLGFPVEPPPKMKNGMHPDLVDGKKVSDRFNRLDPQSAKSMPLTGNPHIDKKVKAARKKPK